MKYRIIYLININFVLKVGCNTMYPKDSAFIK